MLEHNLTIQIPRHRLVDFFGSLMGQPRTIEKEFEIPNLVVTYDHIINIVRLIEQRISQNSGELVSFSCSYCFQSGRVTKISDRESFEAFNDRSQELSVGIDLSFSHLIWFSDSELPEKQNIRIRIFSDAYPLRYPQGARAPGKRKLRPTLSYTIETTNLTWGEDISHHLDNAFAGLCPNDVFFWIHALVVDSSLFRSVVTYISLFSVFWIFFVSSLLHNQIDVHRVLANVHELSGFELIDKKLDALLLATPLAVSPDLSIVRHTVIDHRPANLLLSAGLLLSSWWLVKRFGAIRIVATNEATTRSLESAKKTRDIVQIVFFVALGVGILSSLMAARIEAQFFQSMP
ncbi:hypothetical protein [Bradyrhizobium sp. SZCCHNS2015]|uniref:hypothetical protein n=1 Tax=Bradyrhizobium sp. SZCCHNS2015 TaxID=3057305 RepID=UPI0028ECCC1A|nr:hypothetical protein [Bradyrhizobium sp. SZCCHNS2015]